MQSKKTRITRMAFGIALSFGLYFVNPWLSLIGVVPFLVGASGFCPACYFLNRCSIKRK